MVKISKKPSDRNMLLSMQCGKLSEIGLTLLNDYRIQSEFHLGTFYYSFFYSVISYKAKHSDSLRLSNSMCSVLGELNYHVILNLAKKSNNIKMYKKQN